MLTQRIVKHFHSSGVIPLFSQPFSAPGYLIYLLRPDIHVEYKSTRHACPNLKFTRVVLHLVSAVSYDGSSASSRWACQGQLVNKIVDRGGM